MNLPDYLAQQKLTQSEFAATFSKPGATQALVSQWLSGATTITAERAVQIERVTNCKVTRYELRPDVFGPAPTSAKKAA